MLANVGQYLRITLGTSLRDRNFQGDNNYSFCADLKLALSNLPDHRLFTSSSLTVGPLPSAPSKSPAISPNLNKLSLASEGGGGGAVACRPGLFYWQCLPYELVALCQRLNRL